MNRNLIDTVIELLTFQIGRNEMLNFKVGHFLIGLLGTWIVGMGRYWDDPAASLLQHLGLGSVIYIFVLSLFIWLIVLPYRVEKWRYFTVLTFIGLTSFPAVFYAIPVERWVSIAVANQINVIFLAVVALWRLALLFFFLKRFTRLSILDVLTVTLMPMSLIVTTLSYLNLHRAVFNIMGGLREPTAQDSANGVLMAITLLSLVLVIPLLLTYLGGIFFRWKKLKAQKAIK